MAPPEIVKRQSPNLPLNVQLGSLAIYLAHRLLYISSVEVENEVSLQALANAEPTVITPNHNTDYDVPLALHEVLRYADTKITGQSTHLHLRPSLVAYAGTVISRSRFLPVSTQVNKEGVKSNIFTPEDSTRPAQSLRDGTHVMIATHSPRSARPDKPLRPGLLAPLVALRARAPLLPIQVRTTEASHNRFDARLIVGTPYQLDPVPEIEDFVTIYAKEQLHRSDPSTHAGLTSDEIDIFTDATKQLRQAADQVFDASEALR